MMNLNYFHKIVFLIFSLAFSLQAYCQKKSNINDKMQDSLSKIEFLGFYNENLHILPEWISFCSNLKEIRFSKTNKLDFYDAVEKLSKLNNLKTLELWGITIKIPNNIQKIKSLTNISFLRECNLDFYDVIEKLSKVNKLSGLDIEYCNLKKLPTNIYKLDNLEALSVNGNDLKSLSDSIIYCKKLSYLTISYNKVVQESLQYVLSNLPNLTILDISHNELKFLPDGICSTKIIILNICDNPIDSLPECLFYSNTLRLFYLDCQYEDVINIKSQMNVKAIKEKMTRTTGRFVEVE